MQDSLGDFKHADRTLNYLREKDPKKFEKKKKELNEKREQYLQMFSEKTGISRNIMNSLIDDKVSLWKIEKKIFKEMVNEINPWKKILGKKKWDRISPHIKGNTTRVYSIPEKSNEFVKKAWEEWGG